MSTETRDGSSNRTRGADVGFIPCVRYGFAEGDTKPRQQGTLTSIHEPIPEGAVTASPVYLVSTDRYEHQFELRDPWAIRGSKSCIATEIQDECEQAEKVWYPIYVESDAEVPLDEMAQSLAEFVWESLGIVPELCSFYYSGGRSIHVHVPRFIETETDLRNLKKRAEEWNEGGGVALDAGIYSRKRQFRLLGVRHAKTGLRKVRIESDWSHTRIVRAATKTEPEAEPATYDDVLRDVFGAGFITLLGREAVSDGDEVILRFARRRGDLKVPVEEWPPYSEYNPEVWRWHAYNAKEFSPYANAAVGGRSVCAIEVVGTPYQRADFGKEKILVPARFYGAVGCDGKFTKEGDRHAPLQLSRRDYRKYEKHGYGPGESLVIIGGQSRNSRILRVSREVAETVGEFLAGDEGEGSRRPPALDYLGEQGYDVGAAGYKGRQSTTSKRHGSQGERAANRIYPVRNPTTDASVLQQRAEQEPGAITEFTHQERVKLACRLLRFGTWDAVWGWFSQQFGDAFKPDLTYTHLTTIVNQYPVDYAHVEVPPPPQR